MKSIMSFGNFINKFATVCNHQVNRTKDASFAWLVELLLPTIFISNGTYIFNDHFRSANESKLFSFQLLTSQFKTMQNLRHQYIQSGVFVVVFDQIDRNQFNR